MKREVWRWFRNFPHPWCRTCTRWSHHHMCQCWASWGVGVIRQVIQQENGCHPSGAAQQTAGWVEFWELRELLSGICSCGGLPAVSWLSATLGGPCSRDTVSGGFYPNRVLSEGMGLWKQPSVVRYCCKKKRRFCSSFCSQYICCFCRSEWKLLKKHTFCTECWNWGTDLSQEENELNSTRCSERFKRPIQTV